MDTSNDKGSIYVRCKSSESLRNSYTRLINVHTNFKVETENNSDRVHILFLFS